jgi:hypothetical protein
MLTIFFTQLNCILCKQGYYWSVSCILLVCIYCPLFCLIQTLWYFLTRPEENLLSPDMQKLVSASISQAIINKNFRYLHVVSPFPQSFDSHHLFFPRFFSSTRRRFDSNQGVVDARPFRLPSHVCHHSHWRHRTAVPRRHIFRALLFGELRLVPQSGDALSPARVCRVLLFVRLLFIARRHVLKRSGTTCVELSCLCFQSRQFIQISRVTLFALFLVAFMSLMI